MDWFLYDNGPRHERVNAVIFACKIMFMEMFVQNLCIRKRSGNIQII